MSQFYKLNLAEPLLVLTGIRRFLVWVAIGVLIGALIVFGAWLNGAYNRPTVRPRLARLNAEAMRVLDVCDAWQRMADEYRPLYPLLCRQDERSAAGLLRVVYGIRSVRPSAGIVEPPLGYLPIKLSAVRDRQVVLSFDLPLPDYARGEYRDAAYAYFTNVAALAAAKITNCPAYEVSLSWDPNVIQAGDKASRGTLVFSFEGSRKTTPSAQALPKGLKDAQGCIEKWHKEVFAIVPVKPPRGTKPKDAKDVGKYITSATSFAKGVTNLASRVVDPLSLAEPIAKESGSDRLKDFEAVWQPVVDARWPWRRNKILDTPRLDADADYLAEVVADCPKMTYFDSALVKCGEFYDSVTGGVHRIHIEEERLFEEKVLIPAFRVTLKPSEAAVRLVGDVKVSRKSRVDFPEWHVRAEPVEGGAPLACKIVADVVDEVEKMEDFVDNGKKRKKSLHASLWVTSLEASFNPKAPPSTGSAWPGLVQINFAGRVPCCTE